MKVLIKHNRKIISGDILLATTTYSRMVGLMFRSSPPENSGGLLIDPCNSIHTCFMKYALDVVFMSAENEVVKVLRGVRPWRLTWIYFKARKTLELPAGGLPHEVKEGDFLEVENV